MSSETPGQGDPTEPVLPAPAPGPAPAPAPAWASLPPPVQPPAPQPPAPQAGWGGPPAQPQAGWGESPGGGQIPPGGWVQPPPKAAGNGCLRACLIVAVIGLVLFTLAVIGSIVLGMSFLGGLGVTSDGSLKACPLVSNADLSTALGKEALASELGGLADATFGQVLDKRVLRDAPDCWVGAGSKSSAGLGRIAKDAGGDAAAAFKTERAAATAGGYLAQDLPGTGDEAFCTGISDFGATGALVRKGDNLVYVSLIDAGPNPTMGLAAGDTGVEFSLAGCKQARDVALLVLH
jgi:hypothetical protein